jgi:DNA invertase Pin-like site-specific DNA recombinase
MAFVYQRLSTTEQKKNSRYSLERQDDLERLAREDGYTPDLIYVERRDLGISGTKGQEEREGLAYLIQLIEQAKVESVYVIEISRISRDQTLINGLQFGELCREYDVIIVTPTMRLNLRDEMHMRMYRYEIDRAAEELKSIRFRMQGAKEMKARHGYHVGNHLPSGYVIDTDERLPNGAPNPNHQKYKIYEPHAQVVRTLFRMMAKPGAYLRGVALECKRTGIVFARLPEELLAVKGNNASFATSKPNPDGSYPITLGRLESIVSNPAYIGWFLWSGAVISKNNHAPIIDEETFWLVQKKRRWTGVRHGPSYETLPLAGLLHCTHHDPPRRMVSSNARNRKHARYLCLDEDEGPSCLTIFAYILEDPIGELIVSQCRFPQYAEQVLQSLTAEYEQAKDKVAANKREYDRIAAEIENLKANLSRTRNPEQVDMMLEMIDAKVAEKQQLATMESQPMGQVLSTAEVATVKEFLTHIDRRWAEMTDRVKNTFLSLLLERIDITHDEATISARVTWRTELQQNIRIERPFVDTRQPWCAEEDAILREHYAKTSQRELCALLPGRSWGSIRKRAGAFHLQRPVEVRTIESSQTTYTDEEDQVIRDFHAFKITRTEMLKRLPDRSADSINRRSIELGFKRRERFAKWELVPPGAIESNGGEIGAPQEINSNADCSKIRS